jgi:uncharacterized protein YndB with AHSA1/START domain
MGHEFEAVDTADVDASIDEVWQAIATGPGIDSWFMGRTAVADGVVRTIFAECPITASEPGKHFAYGATPAPDGRFVAFDFLIEGRAGGGTSVRLVTSGFLPDDDWADEFEAMTMGGAMYFRTLVEYLSFFAGRTATPVTASGPVVADWDRAWSALAAELGLDRAPQAGDAVTVRVDGHAPVGGTVYFVNAHNLAVRTDDALYRFVRGFHGPMLGMHHLFAPDADADAAERVWRSWLDRVFA